MLNNDALLTLGVAVGSGEGSTATVGGGGACSGGARAGVQVYRPAGRFAAFTFGGPSRDDYL